MKYLVTIFVLLPFLLSAQQERYEDPQARKKLQALKERIEKSANLHYQFQLMIEPPEEAVSTQSGNYWQEGTSYRLQLPEYEFICNGSLIWIVDHAIKEIQLHNYSEPDPADVVHPQNLLTIYDNPNFRYRMTAESAIEFFPMDRDFEYFRALLKPSSKDKAIESIEVWGKDGSHFEVAIEKLEQDVTLDFAFFHLATEQFPGYHIEDLRID